MRTEQISPRYVELDSWPVAEMIAAMYEGQLAAAAAVRGALGAIAAAVEDAVPALQRGGRIVYAGAGTSGRPIVLCLPWRAGLMRSRGASSRPRTTRPPARRPWRTQRSAPMMSSSALQRVARLPLRLAPYGRPVPRVR